MTQTDDVGLLTPGKVVRLRERLWRVDYREGSVFGATALDGRDNRPTRFHVELEHVESGELPFPGPNAIGDERQQRLLLDAYRFSLLHGTAPILGLQRSRAIPTDFQIVPLLMALGSERVRLLIADDVGTGKTVEAGLILAELLARGRARRVLIVVPANLRDQWRETLETMFHIDATIVAGHLLPALERRLLPGQSVWATHDVIIASVDYVKTRTEEVLSHSWDLVLVDEAHLAAQPHTEPGRSIPDMERFAFVREAAHRCRHLLLLTATPHNGYTDSYASLFRMLNPALVQDGPGGPRVRRAAAREHHVVQRRRADIDEWYRERGVPSPFPERRADEQIVALGHSPDMVALLDELKAYAGDLYDAATGSVDRWVAAHLQKRLLSSPAALRSSIDKRLSALTRGIAFGSGATAARIAEEATSDLLFTEDDEADAAHLNASVGLTQATEISRLHVIAELARKVTPAKDPKLIALLRLLPERMAAHPHAQRVLVFTKYKDTLDYLVTNLIRAVGKERNHLPVGMQVFAIHGGLNLAQRNEVFSAFETAELAVLVATDCISEGVNLQRACAELVHYELPWNPNRLEQRNGRIDRFHQREPFVGIRTLVLDDPLDASLLYLIVRKSEQMRAEYGFVPPFLANTDILLHLSDPHAAYRARLSARSSAEQLSLFADGAESHLSDLDEELARLAESSLASSERVDRVRDESFYGQSRISLTAIEDALNQSRAVTGTTEQVRDFTLRCLRDMHGDITADGPVFRLAHSPASVTDLAPAGYRFTFDPTVGMDHADVDVIDLAHPLLGRLIDITLDRARLPDCDGRVAAHTTSAQVGHAAVLHVLFRYVAKAEPPVLLEEIVPIGYRTADNSSVDAEAVLAAPVGSGTRHRDDIMDDATDILHAPDLRDRLERLAAERAHDLAMRHSHLSAAWARGLDRVEPTSLDLVAVTVIYPEVAQ